MAETISNENQQKIIEKLVVVITDETDQALVLSFLAAQGNESVYMNTLSSLLNNDKAFNTMATQFLQDIRTSKSDPKFIKIMGDLWESYVKDDPDGKMDRSWHLTLTDYAKSNVALINLQSALAKIPPQQRTLVVTKLLSLAKSVAGSESQLVKVTAKTLRLSERTGAVAPVAIAAVQLSWEALKSIAAWWKGDITGARCVANIVNSAATISGGFAGGYAGTVVGTLVFPGVGTVAGALVGGIAGSAAAGALSKWLTEYLFDLPPTAALENAYKFLNLPPSCTNAEINAQFKKLALKYHPDKGGSAEKFHKLQVSVALIKQARGQGV